MPMTAKRKPESTGRRFVKVCHILDQHGRNPSRLMPILQAVQEEYRYLPEEVLTYVATALGVSPARVYGVATFYAHFALEPKGKHLVRLCDGTACHVKDSVPILRRAAKAARAWTTSARPPPDMLFTVETVACLGACGLAPVVVINDQVHGQMTPESAVKLVEAIITQEAANERAKSVRGPTETTATRRNGASSSAPAPAAWPAAPTRSSRPSWNRCGPPACTVITEFRPEHEAGARAPDQERLPGLLPDGAAGDRPAREPALHQGQASEDVAEIVAETLVAGRVGRAAALRRPGDEEALPRHGRDSVLPAPAALRAARLRHDRPGEHRRVRAPRRLCGGAEGLPADDAGADLPGDHPLGPARPRRRRLPHRAQVGSGPRRSPRARNTSSATPTRATRARS